MKIEASDLQGVVVIDLTKIEDERGHFARTFCRKEFERAGLETDFVQGNTSLSRFKGTLRGMHYQTSPHAETKLIRCIKGAIFDVVVDLRKESPTYKQSRGFVLSEENNRQVYVPKGCAHGFLTLEDNSAVSYLVSAFYTPEAEQGLRWNDPALAIDWPHEVVHMSNKDANWPDYDDAMALSDQL